MFSFTASRCTMLTPAFRPGWLPAAEKRMGARFATPMSLTRLLEDNPDATRDEIKRGLAGNVCRCTGYERIIDAALAVHGEGGLGN